MNNGLVAKSSIKISAPAAKVWEALTTPEIVKQYMFGTTVNSDWRAGSVITWKGEWKGKTYEDKGQILQIEKNHVLKYSHFSPLSGVPDVPENYHIVTVELSNGGNHTTVHLSQDGNETEESRKHSEQNWKMMLESLKKILEQ